MIKEIEIESLTGLERHIVITAEDSSTLSMLKSKWDELEAQKELGGTL